ncbi:hypothetical protein PTKIN_Ptkin17bG0168900 [Pterospermum kingtungense]
MDPEPPILFKTALFLDGCGATDGGMETEDRGWFAVAKGVDGGNEVGEGEDAGDCAIVERNKGTNRKKQRMLEYLAI